MQINFEETIFKTKRFNPEKTLAYGFELINGEYVLAKEILDGEFIAELRVKADGAITGRVIDTLTGEELAQLKNSRYEGSFIGTVRDGYEKFLKEIADSCCDDVTFASDQSNRVAGMIEAEFGVIPDFPWDNSRYSDCGVFRHTGSGKWFGLIMNVEREKVVKRAGSSSNVSGFVDVINLKIDEEQACALHKKKGIYPAYHMNHKKWISVLLDDSLSDDEVMELVSDSHRLTDGGGSKVDETLIKRVLDVADSVPEGCVTTYGEIAKFVGREKNARLVGKIMSMADRYGEHPCHRVVNASGRTVPGWKEQRGMLEAEGVKFKANGLVDMKEFLWKPGE